MITEMEKLKMGAVSFLNLICTKLFVSRLCITSSARKRGSNFCNAMRNAEKIFWRPLLLFNILCGIGKWGGKNMETGFLEEDALKEF